MDFEYTQIHRRKTHEKQSIFFWVLPCQLPSVLHDKFERVGGSVCFGAWVFILLAKTDILYTSFQVIH